MVASVVVVVCDVEVVFVVVIVEVEVVVIVVGWISTISVLPFVAAADPHNARSVVTAAIVPVRELRMNDALDILNHLSFLISNFVVCEGIKIFPVIILYT